MGHSNAPASGVLQDVTVDYVLLLRVMGTAWRRDRAQGLTQSLLFLSLPVTVVSTLEINPFNPYTTLMRDILLLPFLY